MRPHKLRMAHLERVYWDEEASGEMLSQLIPTQEEEGGAGKEKKTHH